MKVICSDIKSGWAIPGKKIRGSCGHNFFENRPGIFNFFTSALEIRDKTKIHPEKLHK